MGQAYKYGLMELAMKGNGDRIKQMAKGSFGMQMETSMKENGLMIRLTAMAFMCMLTELSMRDSGRMICRMDMVLKVGQMAASMKVDTKKA